MYSTPKLKDKIYIDTVFWTQNTFSNSESEVVVWLLFSSDGLQAKNGGQQRCTGSIPIKWKDKVGRIISFIMEQYRVSEINEENLLVNGQVVRSCRIHH